jgi:hypothetical protein
MIDYQGIYYKGTPPDTLNRWRFMAGKLQEYKNLRCCFAAGEANLDRRGSSRFEWTSRTFPASYSPAFFRDLISYSTVIGAA